MSLRFALVLSAATLVSCRAQEPSRSASAGPAGAAGSTVAATVDGVAITIAEVDERAKESLTRVRQQEYEARRQALDDLIVERLIAKEAQGRGVSVEALLAEEIDKKLPEPDLKQVALVYEQNRQRFGTRTQAEAEAEIVRAFWDRARSSRRAMFAASLQAKAKLAVTLEPPRTVVDIPGDAPVLGPAAAKVTIVAFADYQCPYCQRAQTVVDQVVSSYGSKVKFVHRDFPLDGHPQAVPAARAARCAGEQGRFWEYHRSLMLEPGDLRGPDLTRRAQALKLDLSPFASCVASDRYDTSIREGLQAGLRLGVNSTPTFFVNGQMLVGAKPFEEFSAIIEDELRLNRAAP
jgi:protein-disulfide isomerase